MDNQQISTTTERVDDIPLLLAQMRKIDLAQLIDRHFPVHGNWQGLSLGHVTVGWLSYILAEGDHRLNHVQTWAQRLQITLSTGLHATVRALDFSDDRLACALDYLAHDAQWASFEGGAIESGGRKGDNCAKTGWNQGSCQSALHACSQGKPTSKEYVMERDALAQEISSQDVARRLDRHPIMKARMIRVLDMLENTNGDLKRADEAEQRAIDEMRAMGQELLQGWGQRLADEEAQRAKKDKALVRQVKKTELAQYLR
jgi:hypothetical protein